MRPRVVPLVAVLGLALVVPANRPPHARHRKPSSVAFSVRASVCRGAGGAEVLPTDWSDNYVTLWPGESVTLTARYRASDLGGAAPSVEVFGHNVARVVK